MLDSLRRVTPMLVDVVEASSAVKESFLGKRRPV
jgi:hypothetical protein